MDLYTSTSYQLARQLTKRYSTSFSKSSDLFDPTIRPHIFAIYGMVRIADEVVDTYTGSDAVAQLNALETDVYAALTAGFSTNPLLHAFAVTARQYGITKRLIDPFFKSMRMDLELRTYTQKTYETYIYGSAEVIGLMCLRVFCEGNDSLYAELEAGAKALGSAYQKVNFLRDIAADYKELGRVYFPGVTFAAFDEKEKKAIIKDIAKDFNKARPSVERLPKNARTAVSLSYAYYSELLSILKRTPAETLKTTRVSVPALKKLQLLTKVRLKGSI